MDYPNEWLYLKRNVRDEYQDLINETQPIISGPAPLDDTARRKLAYRISARLVLDLMAEVEGQADAWVALRLRLSNTYRDLMIGTSQIVPDFNMTYHDDQLDVRLRAKISTYLWLMRDIERRQGLYLSASSGCGVAGHSG